MMVDEQLPQFDVLGRYAGFVTRLAAFVVDRAITAIIGLLTVVAVQYALDAFRINQLFGFGNISWQAATGIGVGGYPVLSVIYDLTFWMLTGQTPGKRLMGVRVVRADGARLHLGNAIRRELAYVLSGILFLGYLWILLDNKRQGWHDKLAGTIVVYSWPEGELGGTLIRDRVQRFVQERQAAQREKGSA
jgi:uncharacterized RDD family membrane protein YckC